MRVFQTITLINLSSSTCGSQKLVRDRAGLFIFLLLHNKPECAIPKKESGSLHLVEEHASL